MMVRVGAMRVDCSFDGMKDVENESISFSGSRSVAMVGSWKLVPVNNKDIDSIEV
jgi:hypothetical protein